VALLPVMNDDRAAVTTLLLAVPYLVFIIGEHRLHVSGVVSVVACGLTIGTAGRASVSPFNWTFLEEVWEQLAFWAGSLIFILASLLVPSMLMDIGPHDLWLLFLLIVAATVSRGAVLFGILPWLTRLRLSAAVSTPYKLVITWGGLRGAVTVALALAVREDDAISDDITRFVVVLATGFVLFTLFVNGISLRWLIKVLRLDQLSPRDQALRDQVVALSLEQVRESMGELVRHYNFDDAQAEAALAEYDERIVRATTRDVAAPTILDRDRLAVGLIALANYERRLVLEHHGHQLVSRRMIEFLLRNVDRLIDGTRSGGRVGYNRAAKRAVSYSLGFRLSHLLHRRFGIEGPLASRLGHRFEALRVNLLILDELKRFNERRLAPILGTRIAELVTEIVVGRQDRVKRLYDALQLQYPEYFGALEARFIRLSALRQEAQEYKTLHEEGLIGQEVYDNLLRAVRHERARADHRPHLDLKLKPEQLISKIDMFGDLTPEQMSRLAKLAKPRLAIPDEVIYRRGARGDSVFFISSGAVEIRMPQVHLTLGRGAIVGQMALLNSAPRVADVVALTYSHLLMLYEADFRRFLDGHPDLRAHIEEINSAQMEMNAAIAQGTAVDALQHGSVKRAEPQVSESGG
jgi:CPA1 family monovalent cation:H+ antiporter